jgi:hypothetical protein
MTAGEASTEMLVEKLADWPPAETLTKIMEPEAVPAVV